MSDQPHIPWFEKLIRDAEVAGEFDDLPGSGKPIDDLDRFYEPTWWTKRFLERERLNDAAIELVGRMRSELPRVMAGRGDAAVRTQLEHYNEEIKSVNAAAADEERIPLLDVDRLLRERSKRQS